MKKPAQLTSLYYQSVGRGATLLLNVPPNRSGRLPGMLVRRLKEVGQHSKDR